MTIKGYFIGENATKWRTYLGRGLIIDTESRAKIGFGYDEQELRTYMLRFDNERGRGGFPLNEEFYKEEGAKETELFISPQKISLLARRLDGAQIKLMDATASFASTVGRNKRISELPEEQRIRGEKLKAFEKGLYRRFDRFLAKYYPDLVA